jgi:formate/nitrite transporter FocA (FNT family)
VVKAASNLAVLKANTPLSSLFVGGFMSGAYLGFAGLIMTIVGERERLPFYLLSFRFMTF